MCRGFTKMLSAVQCYYMLCVLHVTATRGHVTVAILLYYCFAQVNIAHSYIQMYIVYISIFT